MSTTSTTSRDRRRSRKTATSSAPSSPASAPSQAGAEATPRSEAAPESVPRLGLPLTDKARPRAPWDELVQRTQRFLAHLGQVGQLASGSCKALVRRPFEIDATLHQLESLGLRSLSIAAVTAVFVGMVMAVQFAMGLQKFGGVEYTGRIVGLSFARELAPTLTAVIVGGRIASGIAAEVGAMAVTEQIDAIRALGADPIKKLVLPRLLACIVVMPVLGAIALALGFAGATLITYAEFRIPPGFFLRTALSSVSFHDVYSGMYKCPFFGAIIALVGCHFGLRTWGGTEGVGRSTTRAVVATSISILIADFLLTKLSLVIFPSFR